MATVTSDAYPQYMLSVFLFIFIMITYFFQVEKEVLDEIIQMERMTALFKELGLDKRTAMIEATDSDDKEVLVILRSMKSAVSHFVGDNKCLSVME